MIVANSYPTRTRGIIINYYYTLYIVQHKNWKGKILKIWITIICHGVLGHEVQESWPYLSNATPCPYELSHVKNEFSLVGLTAFQYENGLSER